MIDLETTGVAAGCGILSIGATTFDLEHKFYSRISHADCVARGLKDNLDTMAWWNKQSFEARSEAFGGEDLLVVALGKFADWFNRLPGDRDKIFVWGNGADFDLPILGAAFDQVGMRKPWKPFNGRCYRTLKNLYFGVKAPDFEGVKHNALADAVHQARHAREILRVHFAD